MQNKSIFISYRRKDSVREARALFERLSREFGADNVFIDLAGIQPGEDFMALLDRLLANCAVLLVLIGPDWAQLTHSDGRRRLEHSNDFVRMEVSAALARGVRVVPVCFDGAEMPLATDLPEELQPLVRRQSVALDFNRFEGDIAQLLKTIRLALEAPQPGSAQPAAAAATAPARLGRVRVASALVALVGACGLAAQSLAPQWFHDLSARETVVQALAQSNRLAMASAQAVGGASAAFDELEQARAALAQHLGELDQPTRPAAVRQAVAAVAPLVQRGLTDATLIGAQRQVLVGVGASVEAINRLSPDMLEQAEAVHSMALQQGARPVELAVASQLVMLTQRLAKSANEVTSINGLGSASVFMLGKDLNTFRELGQGMLTGDPELRLPGIQDAGRREALQRLLAQYEQLRNQGATVLSGLQGLVAAREANVRIAKDSAALRTGLDSLRAQIDSPSRGHAWTMGCMLLLVVGVAGWSGLLPRLLRRLTPRRGGIDH